jgi:hypothetical protein
MPPEKELIKQQMSQTRSALSEKMEGLENKVLGTVHSTTDTFAQTVQDVSSSVQTVGATVRETAQDVRSTVGECLTSVHEAFDLTRQMHQHPWLMLGSSVVAGYVGGRVLDNLERGRLLPAPPLPSHPEQLLPSDSELRERIEAQPPVRRTGSTFFKALLDTFGPELDKLKRAAVGMAVAVVRDKISESVPPQMRENFTEMMDRVATKLGGEPPPPGAMFGREEGDESNGSRMAGTMGRS